MQPTTSETEPKFLERIRRGESLNDGERQEFLRWAFADFTRFCSLLQVPLKEGGRIPMRLSRIQRRYIAKRTARDIILKPRQVYMTTLEAARDLWWFLTKPGAHVILVCQSQTDMSAMKDIAEKFRIFIDSLRIAGVAFDFGKETTTEWTLPKTDAMLRIIQAGASEASASKKGRGGTVNRLHISEAAFFERAQDTFNSLQESVARTGSEVVNESTPNGASGFYYDQWQSAVEGRSAYTPHFFGWWHHPEYRFPLEDGETFEPTNQLEELLLAKGVPAECLKWYRWKIKDKGGNADLVAQEYPSDPESCFLVSGRTFFDQGRTKELLAGITDAIETIRVRISGAHEQMVDDRDGPREVPAIRIFHAPVRGNEYVLALDTAEGTEGDPSAGILFERRTGRHMATLWGQFKPVELARIAVPLARRYNGALIAVERNNHGHAVHVALTNPTTEVIVFENGSAVHRTREVADRPYANLFYDRDDKLGWINVAPTRTRALEILEQAHREGHFHTTDRFLLSEMRTFIVTDRDRAEADRGKNDDLVMGAAIGWDVICRPRPRRDLSAGEAA